jgi:S1-C subfamily serine protease/peptidoglycan hydrolase-like protein with peptidoglycan-binding domain
MLHWVLRIFFVVGLCAATFFGVTGAASAQDQVWVQIEATADLATAEDRVRAYTRLVPSVNGYRASSGLYAIALGPFPRELAEALLRDLRAQGLIPRDSYIETGGIYASQFYPIGANTLAAQTATEVLPQDDITIILLPEIVTGETATDAPASTDPVIIATETPAVPLAPAPPTEETLTEARASERLLDRTAREELQIAMQWFGFYTGRIDGDFGPATRRAMGEWQSDRVFDDTGVLTTSQRAQLLDEYQGELSALGMETVEDTRAGIAIDMPLAMVAFGSYNFPFVQYDAINDSGVQVLLISQPGDRGTLFGLYEIMQTLEIVPLDGTRERRNDSFLLTGQSATMRSHTEAQLTGGAVKGFTLTWPPERDAQMARVLAMMQSSLRALSGALDPGAIPDGIEEDIDMMSGLDVRRAALTRSGFFINDQGAVLTTTEVLDGQCSRILIDNVYDTDIAYRNDALGLAVLRPQTRLAPVAFARLVDAPGRLRSDIAVAGFPFDGALSTASMTFGTLADLRGLNGEDTVQRLDVGTQDSEAGGPVLDGTGNVLGMVLPGQIDGHVMPDDVTFALRADQMTAALSEAGITPTRPEAGAAPLNRETLARRGADMTVTVSCWN